MTTEFTASNGIEIEVSPDGYLLGKGDYGSGPTYATAGPEGIAALREYFTAERDAELGRWRDEESPDYVVYPARAGSITILHEPTGRHRHLTGRAEAKIATGQFADTARRYFATHPEPKPWHSATDGELWKVETTTSATPIICSTDADGDFTPVFGHPLIAILANGSHRIIEATRLWPEQETDR